MAQIGGIIENKVSREKIKWIETHDSSNGARCKFEFWVEPQGAVPFEHLHPNQTETFSIVSGSASFKINGEVKNYKAGETIVVRPGEKHLVFNNGDETLHAVVEFVPSLKVELGLEMVFGLANDGKCDKNGGPGLVQIATTADKYRGIIYVANMPVFMQDVMFFICARIGRLLGKQATYKKYNGFDS